MKDNIFKIITYIDRINLFSDTFLNYYLRFFKPEEFHFLILDSEFDNISDYLLNKNLQKITLEKISNKYFGTVDDILNKQNEVCNNFINQGFIVVYVDIDEIIYHHDLRNYILNNIKDYITPSGIVLAPNSDEIYLNKTDKILNQRKYCLFDNKWYAKTCILNKNYVWTGGRHNKDSNKISNDIYLIDISKCCKQIILENNQTTNKLYKNVSKKYSIIDENYIDTMIYNLLPHLKPLPKYILDNKLF